MGCALCVHSFDSSRTNMTATVTDCSAKGARNTKQEARKKSNLKQITYRKVWICLVKRDFCTNINFCLVFSML